MNNRILMLFFFSLILLGISCSGFAKEEAKSGAIKPEWIAYYQANLGDSSFIAWVAKCKQLHLKLPDKALNELENYFNHPQDEKTKKWASKILKNAKNPDAQFVMAAYLAGQNESPVQNIEQVIERNGYSFDLQEATGCLKYDMDIRLLCLNTPTILDATYPRTPLPAKNIIYLKEILRNPLDKKEVEELGSSLRTDLETISFTSAEENTLFFYKTLGYLNATGDSQFLSDLWSHPGEYPRFVALQMAAYASDQLLVQTILGHIQSLHENQPEEFFKLYGLISLFIEEQSSSPNVREALIEWLLPYGLGEDAQSFMQRSMDMLGSQRWSEMDQYRNRLLLTSYISIQENVIKKARESVEKINEFNLRQSYQE